MRGGYLRLAGYHRSVEGLFNNAKDLEGVIRKYIDEHDALKKDVEKFQLRLWSVPRISL